MADIYDIDAIIKHSLQMGIDISPADRQEWRMFCCALKVLGYDEATFVALSSGKQKDSRQAWRAERSPQRYKSEDSAKGMIVDLAKAAGIDLCRFRLSQNKNQCEDCVFAIKCGARVEQCKKGLRYDIAMKYGKCRAFHRITVDFPAKPRTVEPPIEYAPFIPAKMIEATESRVSESNLFVWLSGEFGDEAAMMAMRRYRVGATKHTDGRGYRAASLPYINNSGDCVDCKIFHIDPTTGSRKTAPALMSWTDKEGKAQELRSTWALAELKKNDKPRKWCNFGDHLLQDNPTAAVCVVESEKTALVASIVYPSRLWIAVGSKNNLNPERCAPYRGRKIIIYPDRDNIKDKPRKSGIGIEKGWETLARELAQAGFSVRIDRTVERHHGEINDDIADIILRYRHGTQSPPEPPQNRDVVECDTAAKSPDKLEAEALFEQMKKQYPALAELAEKFDLEPIRVEPYRDQNKNE